MNGSASRGIPVYIALGSNLGDSPSIIRSAADRLSRLGQLRLSPLHASSPVDCPPGSPDFVNAVVELFVPESQTPEKLLDLLQDLEREFGRRPKSVQNEPRPLDLDVIMFGSERWNTPRLMVPHPRAHLRRFVLQPLTDLAPDLILPGQGQTVTQLLAELPNDPGMRRLR
jgi:2-amino-4-hydroxy-6-hydroxymethyldihydropteridine diphosphokinase